MVRGQHGVEGFAYREVLDKNRDELFLINREGRPKTLDPREYSHQA